MDKTEKDSNKNNANIFDVLDKEGETTPKPEENVKECVDDAMKKSQNGEDKQPQNDILTHSQKREKLIVELLKNKREIIRILKLPENERPKVKNAHKNNKTDFEPVGEVKIADDGHFSFSEEEKEGSAIAEAEVGDGDQSLPSTFPSVKDGDFLNLLDPYQETHFTQTEFVCEHTKNYCKKIQQLMKQFAEEMIEDFLNPQSQARKISEEFYSFLYEFFVTNQIETAEIEILFFFFSKLIFPSTKLIYLTERMFAKFFYETLLRLDPMLYTFPIFKSLEKSILFINSYLKIIDTDKFGNITKLGKSRIIGFEALLHVRIYSENDRVQMNSKRLLSNILSSQLEDPTMQKEVIVEDFLQPVISLLEDEYGNLAYGSGPLRRIMELLKMTGETYDFVLKKVKRYEKIALVFKTAEEQTSDINIEGENLIPEEPSRIYGFHDKIKININNTTFKKPPAKFSVTIAKSETLRDLKHHILEELTCFTEDHICIMAWGKCLYKSDRTIWELKLKDETTILVIEKEKGTEYDIELSNITRHNSKIEQIKMMFGEMDDDFLSYLIFKSGDSLDNAIITLTDEPNKNKIFEEFIELKRLKSQGNNPNGMRRQMNNDSKISERAQKAQKTLSECDSLYDSLLKILSLKNSQAQQATWDLLKQLPPSEKIKKQIEEQFFQENDFASETTIKEEIITNSTSNMTYYYLDVIYSVLEKCLQDKNKNKLLTFFLNESALTIMNLFLYNYDTILEEFFTLCRKEELTTKSLEESETLRKASLLVPALKILHIFYDIGLDSHKMSTNVFPLSSDKLQIARFQKTHEIMKDKWSPFGFEMVTDISLSAVHTDALFNKLTEIYQILMRCCWLNSYNFAGNGNTIELVELIFQLLEKRAYLMKEAGKENEFTWQHVDTAFNYFLKMSTMKTNNLMGNLLLRHIGNFEERSEYIYQKLLDIIIEKGFFMYMQNNIYAFAKFLSKRLNDKKKKELKEGGKEEDIRIAIEECFTLIEKLPKFKEINNSNLQKVDEGNFEGIIALIKSHVSFLQEFKEQLPADKVEAIFTGIVWPNLCQLFSETPTVFYKCVSKGSSNLKNLFFELCLSFCKLGEKYTLKIFSFLGTIYKSSDFRNKEEFQHVEIRKGNEDIGLKNLGCTCYANSLFQQLYHNINIRNNLLTSLPDETNNNQCVLFQVKWLFWRLMYTKMGYSTLSRFCQVFTGFDGMPVNVGVQQDVNEFFNLLSDRLENQLKDAENNEKKRENDCNPFKEEYGGELVNIITSLEGDYPYQNQRSEAFLLVPITIQKMNNIYEALDEFCAEEYFKDDNKLHIEKYDKKIEVSKKAMFRKLPKSLIFNLKRFEYNKQTWQRFKLNNFFEFPMDLDMEKWCQFDADEKETETKYKLKGVLIHSGSAQAGHYYSYIKSGDKWVEFNDTRVTDFECTPINLHKEWYGQSSGEELDKFGFQMGVGGSTCAYMLFYEKEHFVDENELKKTDPGALKETDDWRDFSRRVDEENQKFIRQKIFVDSVSMRFLDELLNELDTPSIIDQLETQLVDVDQLKEDEPEKVEEKTEVEAPKEEVAEIEPTEGTLNEEKTEVETPKEQVVETKLTKDTADDVLTTDVLTAEPEEPETKLGTKPEEEEDKYKYIKNRGILDILVARDATVIHKLASRHKLLKKFLYISEHVYPKIIVNKEIHNSLDALSTDLVFGMNNGDVCEDPFMDEDGVVGGDPNEVIHENKVVYDSFEHNIFI